MATKIPAFKTTCSYATDLIDGYWYIYLYSSGDFRMDHIHRDVDMFLCGGGGAGASAWSENGNGGGGGGYVTMLNDQTIGTKTYAITVGEGGKGGQANTGASGGATSAFGYTAEGGTGGSANRTPGSGYASGGWGGRYKGDGPTDGEDGIRAFGVGDIYYGAGGGGGGADSHAYGGAGGKTGGGAGGRNRKPGVDGAANTGG
ncbi:MAG: hypothetical protein IKU38_10100, partial [Clostridia bacterium]|nr:hypothetical protein [Clostridia bacterium]